MLPEPSSEPALFGGYEAWPSPTPRSSPLLAIVLPVILGAVCGLALTTLVIVASHVPLREAVSPDGAFMGAAR